MTPDDSLEITQYQLDRIRTIVDDMLDRAVLDNADSVIQSCTRLLVLIDNVQYYPEDSEKDDEDLGPRQAELDFDND